MARRRERWQRHQGQIDPQRLVFIDETWTKTNMAPLRGWGRRGDRVKAKAPFGHWNTGVPGGRAFAIKPMDSGVATNITVHTNRRSYYFHVVEARETPHYVVQFRYPETELGPPAPLRQASSRSPPWRVPSFWLPSGPMSPVS